MRCRSTPWIFYRFTMPLLQSWRMKELSVRWKTRVNEKSAYRNQLCR